MVHLVMIMMSDNVVIINIENDEIIIRKYTKIINDTTTSVDLFKSGGNTLINAAAAAL